MKLFMVQYRNLTSGVIVHTTFVKGEDSVMIREQCLEGFIEPNDWDCMVQLVGPSDVYRYIMSRQADHLMITEDQGF
jgi:hypothetical protein